MEGVRNLQLLAPSKLTVGLAGEAVTERGFHGDVHRPLDSSASASQNTPWPEHGGPAAAPRSPPARSSAQAGKSGGQARHAMKGLKAAPAATPAAKALRQRWDGLQPAEPLLGPGISRHTTGCVCLLGQRGKMRGFCGTGGLPWAPAMSSCRAAQPHSSSSAGRNHPSQACSRGGRRQPWAMPQSLSSCFPAACREADVSVPVPNRPPGPGLQRNCHVWWCHCVYVCSM